MFFSDTSMDGQIALSTRQATVPHLDRVEIPQTLLMTMGDMGRTSQIDKIKFPPSHKNKRLK